MTNAQTATIVHKFTKKDRTYFSDDGITELGAIQIAEALNKKTGAATRGQDYLAWYEGSGSGSIRRFDKAVVSLLGQEMRDDGENLARLDIFLRYVLLPSYRKSCPKQERGMCDAFYKEWQRRRRMAVN